MIVVYPLCGNSDPQRALHGCAACATDLDKKSINIKTGGRSTSALQELQRGTTANWQVTSENGRVAVSTVNTDQLFISLHELCWSSTEMAKAEQHSTNTLTIRNMVCDRCRAAVQRILADLGIAWVRVELGEVELINALDASAITRLDHALIQGGFGIVLDRDAQLITTIKAALIEQVHHADGKRVELAKLVQDTVHRELSTMTKLFSEVEGITLEHYFLLQRLERVKELIRYNEMTFSEIAFATGFSSAAHLSAQFKKLTGMTPTIFRTMHGKRYALDRVGGTV